MPEIKSGTDNFMDSIKRKKKSKISRAKPGKLDKQGRIYQNNLLAQDTTAGMRISRKLKD